MNGKYELIADDTIQVQDGLVTRTLYRIRALVDIGNEILADNLGGYIEGEWNLSTEGLAWVADEA